MKKFSLNEIAENENRDFAADAAAAESLEDLMSILQDERAAGKEDIDWTSLKTFGGPDPDDTAEVWSWDSRRLLIGSCADELRIVPRFAVTPIASDGNYTIGTCDGRPAEWDGNMEDAPGEVRFADDGATFSCQAIDDWQVIDGEWQEIEE